jgi:hypothetical protein
MSKELGFSTELHNGVNYIHWFCKKTGEVLDTMKMERKDDGSSQEHEALGLEGGSPEDGRPAT